MPQPRSFLQALSGTKTPPGEGKDEEGEEAGWTAVGSSRRGGRRKDQENFSLRSNTPKPQPQKPQSQNRFSHQTCIAAKGKRTFTPPNVCRTAAVFTFCPGPRDVKVNFLFNHTKDDSSELDLHVNRSGAKCERHGCSTDIGWREGSFSPSGKTILVARVVSWVPCAHILPEKLGCSRSALPFLSCTRFMEG